MEALDGGRPWGSQLTWVLQEYLELVLGHCEAQVVGRVHDEDYCL